MTHSDKLVAAAKAEDTYDLLQHIAWTDVLRPKLEAQVKIYTNILVQDALGTPIPDGKSREQIAGMCYGIGEIIKLVERVLREGEKALQDLSIEGIGLNHIAR
jgi:hypothetical protein